MCRLSYTVSIHNISKLKPYKENEGKAQLTRKRRTKGTKKKKGRKKKKD